MASVPCTAARPWLWAVPALLLGCTRPEPTAAVQAPVTGAPQLVASREPRLSDPACLGKLQRPAVQARAATGELKLGVLAGLKDPSDGNLGHLGRLSSQLKVLGAEWLVVDGDLGDTSEAQEALLAAVASTGLPLLVLPGTREVHSDLKGAEESLARRGVQLIDLSQRRTVDLGDALVVGLPGGFERRQLRAEGACLYIQQDLKELGDFLDHRPPGPPVILVAAVPPRGSDRFALDVSDGKNLGDPRLLPLLTPQRAAFGLFGQVWESGGRALGADGKPLAPRTPVAQLWLNPGAADQTPWPMADGTESHGLAALFTLRGQQGSYELVRPPPAEATRTP